MANRSSRRSASLPAEETDHAGSRAESPATRFLDALGEGDLTAALSEFWVTLTVRTEDRSWSLNDRDAVVRMVEDARLRFPGLVFESHTRHIGSGQVIEEARLRDIAPAVDAPASDSKAVVLDRLQPIGDVPPLNMPVRLTVLHNDHHVNEVILSFPWALLRQALGQFVDPLDLAVSEIQSAFIAPVGSGFTTVAMASAKPPAALAPKPEPEPEPEVVASPPPPERAPEPVPAVLAQEPVEAPFQPPFQMDPYAWEEGEKRPRRKVVPVLVALALATAGGWWFVSNSGTDDPVAARPPKASQGPNANPEKDKPSASGKPKPSPSESVTTKPTPRKPNVTLKSDLAFDINSAELSAAAKAAIAKLARQVHRAKLKGTIYVDGYTDNLGSAAHGLELSQQRARAVAQYLRSKIGKAPPEIVATGHGEAQPIASNATEAGRKQNRRVTITLPKN
jgi:outer membrane protein OmpA-like peptidoglycan-associated protein